MTRPWFQMYSRDWLDNKELRRCSPAARSVLVDLMCLAHEGEPYGYLADRVGALTEIYMASRCVVSVPQLRRSIAELTSHGRISITEDGIMFIPRMVEDEDLRLRRAAGGSKGGNPNLVKHGHNLETDDKVQLEVNHPANYQVKHARAGAESDSVSSSVGLGVLKNSFSPSSRFDEFWRQYPVQDNRPIAEGVWASLVTTENEGNVFDCLQRYLGSDRAMRSPKNPANWLHDAAQDGWESNWPAAVPPDKKGGFEASVERVFSQRLANGEKPW